MPQGPVLNRRDKPIRSVEDWEHFASPGEGRWKEGRSAERLARWWMEGEGEAEVRELLETEFPSLRVERGVAEAQTAFDEWPGGKRNHDLILVCADGLGPVTVGIEAKAGETFDKTLAGYRAAAQKRLDQGLASNALKRLDALTRSIAGATLKEDAALGTLRYQLFSALAGTMAATDSDDRRAVLLVVEFGDASVENRADLESFAERIFDLDLPEGNTWLRQAGTRDLGPGPVEIWLGHLAPTV